MSSKGAVKPSTALMALLAGATGIGFAPVLVKLSEVGPSATAFYRLVLSLPVLVAWAVYERRRPGTQPRLDSRLYSALAVAGMFFAADLAVWHWSLRYTSVANSTLLSNFAPIFVTFGAWILFREKVTAIFMIGMLLAIAGAAVLVGDSIKVSRQHVFGDILAVVTALFYAGYLLSVKRLRETASTATIMAGSGIVAAAGLLGIALVSGEVLWPQSARGWMILVLLALVSHLGGQTLIAYAFGHLPASISSLNLLLQPVVAALAAWLLLGESLGGRQVLGASMVLAGIFVGSPLRR